MCSTFALSSSFNFLKIDISLVRLIAWCACFVIVTSVCYHQSVGTHNIVIEHVVETQLIVSIKCSRLDRTSCSLGCTSVPGLELVSRLEFLGWIMGEIMPLSFPSIKLSLLFWPLLTLCGNLHIALGIELRYQFGNILISFVTFLLQFCSSLLHVIPIPKQ